MSKDQFIFNQQVRDELEKVPVELHDKLLKFIVAALVFEGFNPTKFSDDGYQTGIANSIHALLKESGVEPDEYFEMAGVIAFIDPRTTDITHALLEVFQFFAKAPLTVGEAHHITNFLKEYKVNG